MTPFRQSQLSLVKDNRLCFIGGLHQLAGGRNDIQAHNLGINPGCVAAGAVATSIGLVGTGSLAGLRIHNPKLVVGVNRRIGAVAAGKVQDVVIMIPCHRLQRLAPNTNGHIGICSRQVFDLAFHNVVQSPLVEVSAGSRAIIDGVEGSVVVNGQGTSFR